MKLRIALGCLASLFLSTPVLADLTIGFVDPRAVSVAAAESKAGKQHGADMEKFVKDKRALIQREEEKLKTLQQSLSKEFLALSDAQKQQKEKEFQEKVAAFNKLRQEAEQEAGRKDAEFKRRLEDEIRKVVDEVARSEKANLVFSKGEVLFADVGIDLTEKVVKKLETALQKLETTGGKKKP